MINKQVSVKRNVLVNNQVGYSLFQRHKEFMYFFRTDQNKYGKEGRELEYFAQWPYL